MAKILAASLNCVNGPTLEPCGVCESCVAIANASSLDVIEMDAASNNSVDDIRELRERVAYAPVSGRHKVYILDEAHMLSSQAWNAFLKTLEEPPPNTIFVLATTEANKVLPTVVDRCHRFDFARPAVEDIASVVTRVAGVEGIEIGPEAVGLLARHATGSFRDALGTLEQLVTYSGTSVATGDVLAVLGVADQDLLFGALDAIADGNSREALLSVHRVAESGRDPSSYARDLETHARELLVVQTLGEVPPQVAMTPDHDARLAEQAQRVPRDAVVRLLDLLAAALKAVRDGADARTQLELALVKAASPEVEAGTRALQARIERLEQALSAGGDAPRPAPPPPAAVAEPVAAPTVPVEPTTPTPTPTDAPASAEFEGLLAVWPAVLDSLRSENMVLATALSHGRPVELDGRELVVAFGEDDAFKRRKAEAEARAIGDAVRTVAGAPVRLRFEVRDLRDEPAEAVAPPTDDELVARLVTEFDAEEIQAGEEPEA